MSVEFYRGSSGKFDSRTLSRETLSRWTGRTLAKRSCPVRRSRAIMRGKLSSSTAECRSLLVCFLREKAALFFFLASPGFTCGGLAASLSCPRGQKRKRVPFHYIYIYIYTRYIIYISIYIYIQRERERYIYTYIHICVYIYIYRQIDRERGILKICIYIYTHIYTQICLYSASVKMAGRSESD